MLTNSRPSPGERAAKLRAMLRNGPIGSSLESTGFEGAGPPAMSTADIDRQVDRTKDDLTRIVRDYLGDRPELHRLAVEITNQGGRGLKFLQRDDLDGFERDPEALSGLEAIVRTDGSRPSFLIREGRVDKQSSPLGAWEPHLDADANDLDKLISCVGRIDDPSIPEGFQGTGFLIQENLIVTNRHVLQGIGWKDGDDWALKPELKIDFGHEFRGRESVTPRNLRGVAFAGAQPIDTGSSADHAKLDLALIELAPAEHAVHTVLALDVSRDWAGENAPDIYTIGYPNKAPFGAYPPPLIEQLFQQTWGKKRLAPGSVMRSQRSTEAWTVAHDATTLFGNSGSVIVVAGRAIIAAGLHYGGSKNEPAENWGHILGLALEAADARGKKLKDAFAELDVKLTDRSLSPGDA